jgi:DNA-directed RNA polymerase specialized sigma54-like protein
MSSGSIVRVMRRKGVERNQGVERVSDEKIAKIIEFHKIAYSFRDIAIEVDINESTVARILRKLDVID